MSPNSKTKRSAFPRNMCCIAGDRRRGLRPQWTRYDLPTWFRNYRSHNAPQQTTPLPRTKFMLVILQSHPQQESGSIHSLKNASEARFRAEEEKRLANQKREAKSAQSLPKRQENARLTYIEAQVSALKKSPEHLRLEAIAKSKGGDESLESYEKFELERCAVQYRESLKETRQRAKISYQRWVRPPNSFVLEANVTSRLVLLVGFEPRRDPIPVR